MTFGGNTSTRRFGVGRPKEKPDQVARQLGGGETELRVEPKREPVPEGK